jgi:hypothetical protein
MRRTAAGIPGLNASLTTLGAIGVLTGATLKR